jgi:hypothetical protein
VSDVAASGLVYLFGDAEVVPPPPPPPTLGLRVISQTNSTITLGWTPVQGALGYRFSRQGYTNSDGSPRYSFTWNPYASQVKFSKGSTWYRVEALSLLVSGTYPP